VSGEDIVKRLVNDIERLCARLDEEVTNNYRTVSERDEALAEAAELRKENERLYGVLERYSNRRGQLEARVAELRKDRERLLTAAREHAWVALGDRDGVTRTRLALRAAIDAAMTKEKP